VSAASFITLFAMAVTVAATEKFRADFSKPLDASWKWIREDPSAWRLTNSALEIHLLPGNMWGPANDAKNVLTRPAPDAPSLEILATVENRPTEQYEQVDLVWYYSDSHMVKIGLELVDGKLSVVMGREEGDRTRTMSINPIDAYTVDLRLVVASTNRIFGFFRPHGTASWQKAGDCSLPVLTGAPPKISLQCYQGPTIAERWARITEFRINQGDL
jgi:regulation of enolase protein 1 (concanavalin A-like superfamily)